MFCPNCGEKLETPNQRFCASCGSEIQTTASPEIPSQPVEEAQAPPPESTVPVYDSKPIKSYGGAFHSKKSFTYSLISIGFFVAGMIFGSGMILRMILPFYFFPFFSGRLFMPIVAFVLHLIGFIFGIVSRENSSKAKKSGEDHALGKVGSVFGVFGVILNIVPMVMLPILTTVLLVGIIVPYMPPFYPY